MEDMFRVEGTVLWIKVPEELDHHIAEKMNAGADRIVERQNIRRICYDFQQTVFMDSSGIGSIMGRYRNIRLIGGEIEAVHVQNRVEKILHLAGVDKVITIKKEKRWRGSYGEHE